MTETSDLVVDGLSLRFGGVHALDDVSFTAAAGDITAVIGPNGAGKTSLFNCVTGLYKPTSGEVRLGDARISNTRPHRIAGHGVARTFQTPALFKHMTVHENLLAARYMFGKTGLVRNAFLTPKARASEKEQVHAVGDVVDMMNLGDLLDLPVSSLSYGVMKRVELARALCQAPRLLLLDEPMAGMTLDEKVDMSNWILEAQDELGTSVLLIEHDMGIVMDLADHVVVLDFGRKIGEGAPAEVRSNPAVIAAYLGEEIEELNERVESD